MRKLLSVGLLVAVASCVFAQETTEKPSPASIRYREYRTKLTEPTFGLAKVKALIKKIKPDKEMNEHMNTKSYDSLTFEEKFTYTMLHGEDESQNCDAMPPFKDEEKKIFGYIPGNFDDNATWSERQRAFLKKNRTKVVSLIRSTMKTRERVGVNLKNAILELEAYELIPDLIAIYNIKKYDQDILTMMMFMMKEGKYEPFVKSQSYEKLYGEQSNYRGFIEANDANQKLVCERAMAFYKSKK